MNLFLDTATKSKEFKINKSLLSRDSEEYKSD